MTSSAVRGRLILEEMGSRIPPIAATKAGVEQAAEKLQSKQHCLGSRRQQAP